ncbi:MAG: electron transport complex subunit RsxB [Hydrogenophaga sp.]|uniref:electron transport complex subunit RsxB n=1 Tax=Hydrogenophaga sp. TaxID=1904254 RepID=UPI002716CE67|nr:electron transport complex subunit RsxB [Hydrogenophaga sp.]MDO9147246.1 electron transport complex subunit RsxB [Hydrogenophaga sp.]MDO9604852.1 electron transport complex subunit RsxB [Hydrogenophaga sp.]
MNDLARHIEAALPQTQCTRCGFPDCASYAQAIASSQADINRCPPGGTEGVARLSLITGRPITPLDTLHGIEGPLTVAVIDEDWCIGCTLCIKACPTDAIVGSNKRMHTVMETYCTGCELCLPVCPVDCIALEVVSGERTGWQAWTDAQAQQARERYQQRLQRTARDSVEHDLLLEAKAEMKLADLTSHSLHTDPDTLNKKRSVIEAALARARAQRSKTPD